MAEVLLSLGSNINREHNIRSCLTALQKVFGDIDVSPVYESEAVGFDGDNFFNLVVAVQTGKRIAALTAILKEIENTHGRDRSSAKFSARTLDIDILTYDALTGLVDGIQLPRDEILKNAFVLLPMAGLRPKALYPGTNVSYEALWKQFDTSSQKLWQVEFSING